MKHKTTCTIGLSLLVLMLCALTAGASTQVFGTIRQDTTWTAAGSPYIVIQNVRINESVTLTIEPGVRVEFYQETDQHLDDKFSITIDGQLIAIGLESKPITFTSARSKPEPGDWNYIEFTEKAVAARYTEEGQYLSGSIFQHVIVEYGGGGDQTTIYARGRAPYLNYVVIRNNTRCGISYDRTNDSFIDNSMFSNNTTRYSCTAVSSRSPLTIRNSTFEKNSASGSGGAICSSSSLTLRNTTFTNNSAGSRGGAISHESSTSLLTVNNSLFTNNSSRYSGGAIYSSSSSLSSINNTTFTNNSSGSSYSGGAIAASSLIVNNCILRDNSSGYYGGAIYLSSLTVKDSTFRNNTSRYSGGAIYASRSLTASNSIFIDNSSNRSSGGAIYSGSLNATDILVYENYGSSALVIGRSESSNINRCTIVDNKLQADSDDGVSDGILVSSSNSDITISDSNIFGHTRYDIINNSRSNIQATENYWGTTDERSIKLNMFDWFDDTSKGEVVYHPYLTTFAGSAPPIPGVITVQVTTRHDTGAVMRSGDKIVITWITTGISEDDTMVVSMKRDSVPESVTVPDNVNWFRFTEHGADGRNDGTEPVTIPRGVAEANDWRFYVRHAASGIYGTANTTFTYAVSLNDDEASAERIFNAAEELYPNWFYPKGLPVEIYRGYEHPMYYRYYQPRNIFLLTYDGVVYYYYNGRYTAWGTVDEWLRR